MYIIGILILTVAGGVQPNMYKKILVPMDGSELAEAILPHVAQLAALYEAQILFLQVFQLSHSALLPRRDEQDYQALPQVGQDELQKQFDIAQAYLNARVAATIEQGIPARSRVAYGPVPATIINVATEEHVDLIAMASHGASGLQGVYYGSVAAGVLQRVDRPLLIVRSHDSR
jgi:nucleotide-binding universal stress UspA family protein